MARKESITIQMILDTAFEMTREEGFHTVTARKVAAKAGCSTQPIFRVYKNMDELWNAIYLRGVDYFHEYYERFAGQGTAPFSNLGMAYISFARQEKHLFRLLFLTENSAKKSMYELLNGKKGMVVTEINKAASMGCTNPSLLFMKMWIFIHGAACMSLSGDFDLSDAETLDLLERSYNDFAGRV